MTDSKMETVDVQFLDAATSAHDMENVEQLLAIAGMLADDAGSRLVNDSPEQESSQPQKKDQRKKEKEGEQKTQAVTCDLCPDKVFAHRKSLRWHQRTVHDKSYKKKVNRCRFCGETFKRHLDKELHQMKCTWSQNEMNSSGPQVDSSDSQMNPSVPKVELSDPQMNSSGLVVSQRKSKKNACKHCGKEYLSGGSLHEHIKIVHEGKKVTCSICGVTMKWQSSLIPHMLQVHNIKMEGKKPLVSTCDECGKTFPSLVKFKEHLRQIHNQIYRAKCKYCTETFLHFVPAAHLLSHPELVKYQCSVCRLQFRNVLTYEKHIKRFNHKQTQQAMDLTDLSCYQCKKQFTNYSNFHLHVTVASCVITEEGLECRICRECFPNKTAMLLHHNSTHAKVYKRGKNAGKPKVNSNLPEGKQQCNICGKLFSFQYNLKHHYNWHKGINYKCDICYYTTLWQAGIRKHKKHHQGDPSTMFQCKICKAPFDSNQMRIHHQFTHKEVSKPACKCGREFKSPHAMMIHARKCKEMEHEEIPGNQEENKSEFKVIREYGNTQSIQYYVCTYCGKEFRHKRWFDAHEQSHLGVATYKCSACGFQSSDIQMSSFVEHLTSCEIRKNMASTQEKYEEAELILDYRSECLKDTIKCKVCSKVFHYKRWWRDCQAAHKASLEKTQMATEGRNNSVKKGRPLQHGKIKPLYRFPATQIIPATVDRTATQIIRATVDRTATQIIPATVDRTATQIIPATVDRNVKTLLSSNPELFSTSDGGKRKRKVPVYKFHIVQRNVKILKPSSPESLNSFLKKPKVRRGANTSEEKFNLSSSAEDVLSETPDRYYYIHEDSDLHGGSEHSEKSNSVPFKIKVRHIYKCGVCDKEYRSKETAVKCETAHQYEMDIHHCSGCKRQFKSPRLFANHLFQCQMWRQAEPSRGKRDEQCFLDFYIFNMQMAEHDDESNDTYCDFDGVPGLFSSDNDFNSESSDDEDLDPEAWANGDNHVDISDLIHPKSWKLLNTHTKRDKPVQNESNNAMQMKAQREETSAKLAPNGGINEEEEDIIDLPNIVSIRFDQNGTTQDEHASVKMERDSVNGDIETDQFTHEVRKDSVSENNAEDRVGFFADIVSISLENGVAKDETASVKIERESMNGHDDIEKENFTHEVSGDSFSPTYEDERGFVFDDIEIV